MEWGILHKFDEPFRQFGLSFNAYSEKSNKKTNGTKTLENKQKNTFGIVQKQ